MYHDSTFVTPDQTLSIQAGAISYSTDAPYSIGYRVASEVGQLTYGLNVSTAGSGTVWTGILLDGAFTTGLVLSGTFTGGINLSTANCANYGLMLANNQNVLAYDHEGSPINILYVNADDYLVLGAGADLVYFPTLVVHNNATRLQSYNNTSPTAGDVWFNGTHFYGRIGSTSYQLDQQSGAGYLLIADIDDAPVNNETSAPISSNWAYDHVAAADPHTGYRLESADHTHQSTGAQAGKIDHGAALDGLTDDDHTQYAKLAGRASSQVLVGGTGAGEKLELRGTSHATDGYISIINSHVSLDNSKPFYWENAAAALKNMLYLNASDQFVIGADLGSGKLVVNIDGSLKTLSIDGSGFVKAS
jgi:hypothetical protein